jgi:hypothetical protein
LLQLDQAASRLGEFAEVDEVVEELVVKLAESVMVILVSLLVGVIVSTVAVANDAVQGESGLQLPKEIKFDGFGLDQQIGRTGIAQALKGLPATEASAADELPVDLLVTGPSSSRAGSGAMTAEVGQQFSFLSVSAGMLADRDSIFTGPAGWTSRLAMEFEGETASGGLELRTQLRQTSERQTVGIELGPRLEQQLPRGIRLFFEGSAEARAEYDRTGELAPTGGPLQRPEVIGLSGTVGIAR